jgi:monoamine oxidase
MPPRGAAGAPPEAGAPQGAYVRPSYFPWADLLRRVFALDVLACPNCGGGAGSIARRVAEELGAAVRLSTPVRAIRQAADRVTVESDALTVTARHTVVAVPPALALEIAFDPALPQDRLTLYRHSTAGPETKTLLVYDEPFWRAEGFSGQSAGPQSASEVTLDASILAES